jgi:NitT/TauT family transport system permease protein/taurine transport system permease protein
MNSGGRRDALPSSGADADELLKAGRLRHPHAYAAWLVAACLLFLWWLVSALHIFTPLALPSPQSVAQQIYVISTTGYNGFSLLDNMGSSVLRIAVGFVAAVIVGIPIGFWMASSAWVFNAIDPILQFLRPIPPLAYIPVLVIWFGTGQLSKFVLIFFCTIPLIIISAMAGVKDTQETRIRVAQVFGASGSQTFRYVILPSALPEIFTGMRIAIGVAWTCLVAAEMIAAQSGLGAMILTAGDQLRMSVVFVGIIFIGIIGYLMELVIRTAERRLVPWKGKA